MGRYIAVLFYAMKLVLRGLNPLLEGVDPTMEVLFLSLDVIVLVKQVN